MRLYLLLSRFLAQTSDLRGPLRREAMKKSLSLSEVDVMEATPESGINIKAYRGLEVGAGDMAAAGGGGGGPGPGCLPGTTPAADK